MARHHVGQPRLLLCGHLGRTAPDDGGVAFCVRLLFGGPRTDAGPHCLLGVESGHERVRGRLAQEVDRDGINVHVVTPGPVETEMLQDVPFEMYAIRAADVAEAVAWLDTIDPSVDLPEIRLHAVTRGPSARPPVVPLEAQRRAGK